MPYLQRLSRSSCGRRVMNMPCSAARRGYRRRMTSLGVMPEQYALFISLKSNEMAFMMSLAPWAPFRKLCFPRPIACRMLLAILACKQMHESSQVCCVRAVSSLESTLYPLRQSDNGTCYRGNMMPVCSKYSSKSPRLAQNFCFEAC